MTAAPQTPVELRVYLPIPGLGRQFAAYLGTRAAKAAAEDRGHRDRMVSRVIADREWFAGELQALDFLVSPTSANFVFTHPPDGVAAGAVFEGLKERQILVRYFTKPPLDGWLRITIGTREQLAKVLRGISEILQQ